MVYLHIMIINKKCIKNNRKGTGKMIKKLLLTVFFVLSIVGLSFSANPFQYPLFQVIDADGDPVAGGLVYTYVAGTTTNKVAYTDSLLTVPASNPIELDSKGEATFYLSGLYKINVKTSSGVQVDGFPIDNVFIDAGAPSKSLANDYGCDMPTALTTLGSVNQSQIDIDCACIIASGTIVTSTDNITLNVISGGSFDGVAGGGTETLDINGPILAGEYTWFGDNLTVTAGPIINEVNVAWFNANADNADNSIAIQRAIDMVESMPGGIVRLNKADYEYATGLVISEAWIRFLGTGLSRSILTYSGTGIALDYQLTGASVYPSACELGNFSIIISGDGAIGIQGNFSHTTTRPINIFMSNDNQIGFNQFGDATGSGPYYNEIFKLDVQGNAHTTSTNQIGINLFHDSVATTRSPNANKFFGSRVGQCTIGRHIEGNGNIFYSPVSEGNVSRHFEFNHVSNAVGCADNAIYSPYVEAGAASIAFYTGTNSVRSVIRNPNVTSVLTVLDDNGTFTDINIPGSLTQRPIDKTNTGVYGLVFDEVNNVGIFMTSSVSPEGFKTAGIGSVCLRINGSTGTTVYIKESGTGNTGWAALNYDYWTTTADLEDKTSAINITGKTVGKMVYNINTKIAVWSTNVQDVAVWVDATGATAHTPI